MKKIALIDFYFGNSKPEYIDFYLSSVAYNKEIDLYLFTNLQIKSLASNIKIINTTFEKFVEIIKEKVEKELRLNGINDKVNILTPYKISDFRPTFGLCFADYLKNYDFWGSSDLDLIFGNIQKYISDDILNNYDKIYENGHFFLIRNNEKCNLTFLEDYKNSFYSVLHSDKNTFYEEVYKKKWMIHGGINSRFEEHNTLYKNRQALCDISFKYHNLIDLKNPVNSKYIVFMFDKGVLYRVYKINNKVFYEEVFYAHFQKRKLRKNTNDLDRFFVNNNSFNSIPDNELDMFKNLKKVDYMTYRYFKFRYIDSIKRKINGDFRLKKGND